VPMGGMEEISEDLKAKKRHPIREDEEKAA
jgi:hypothetical protein